MTGKRTADGEVGRLLFHDRVHALGESLALLL
jgi:hypothetical protein